VWQVVLVFATDVTDREDIGCWIPRRPLHNIALRLVNTYVVIWVAVLANCALYYATVRAGRTALESERSRQQRQGTPPFVSYGAAEGATLSAESFELLPESSAAALDRQLRRLALVPVAFVACRSFGSINMVKDIVSPDRSLFVVSVLEAFGDQAQALIYAIIFVFAHEGVRNSVAARWRQLLGRGSRKSSAAPRALEGARRF
jgi:hypothetical protein